MGRTVRGDISAVPGVADTTDAGGVRLGQPRVRLPVDQLLLLEYQGENPFGHSGRRIADFYAGLVGDFRNTQRWKRLRRTKHDHHPVRDALGNAEALIRMLDGER